MSEVVKGRRIDYFKNREIVWIEFSYFNENKYINKQLLEHIQTYFAEEECHVLILSSTFSSLGGDLDFRVLLPFSKFANFVI